MRESPSKKSEVKHDECRLRIDDYKTSEKVRVSISLVNGISFFDSLLTSAKGRGVGKLSDRILEAICVVKATISSNFDGNASLFLFHFAQCNIGL